MQSQDVIKYYSVLKNMISIQNLLSNSDSKEIGYHMKWELASNDSTRMNLFYSKRLHDLKLIRQLNTTGYPTIEINRRSMSTIYDVNRITYGGGGLLYTLGKEDINYNEPPKPFESTTISFIKPESTDLILESSSIEEVEFQYNTIYNIGVDEFKIYALCSLLHNNIPYIKSEYYQYIKLTAFIPSEFLDEVVEVLEDMAITLEGALK